MVQLDAHLAEFRDFMHQVETGKIHVTQGFKGNWQSYIKKDGALIAAGYTGREGLVVDFQKRKDQDPFPLIYGFQISTNGYLKQATTIEDGFQFDEHGRVGRTTGKVIEQMTTRSNRQRIEITGAERCVLPIPGSPSTKAVLTCCIG